VTVRVVGFARARELLGDRGQVSVADGGSIADAWAQLVTTIPELSELSASVRFAVDGALTRPEYGLRDGQELAILPPVGGG
jgi:molybdopterin converting factor small subunit